MSNGNCRLVQLEQRQYEQMKVSKSIDFFVLFN